MTAGIVPGNQAQAGRRLFRCYRSFTRLLRFLCYRLIGFVAHIYFGFCFGFGIGRVGILRYDRNVGAMGFRIGHNLSFFANDGLRLHAVAQQRVSVLHRNVRFGFRPGAAVPYGNAQQCHIGTACIRLYLRVVVCFQRDSVCLKLIAPAIHLYCCGARIPCLSLGHCNLNAARSHGGGFGCHFTGTLRLQADIRQVLFPGLVAFAVRNVLRLQRAAACYGHEITCCIRIMSQADRDICNGHADA